MKKKIIGIFVCMLLIATMAIPISALNDFNKSNTLDTANVPKTTTKDADVPVWVEGDSWTYDANIYISSAPNGTDGMIYYINGELIFEVVDDTGDTYTLKGLIKPLSGKVTMPGIIGFKATRISSWTIDLELQKADLAIVKHRSSAKGILLLTIGPVILPIPIQMQNYRLTEFDPPFNILPFPLSDGDSGTYVNSTLHEEGELSMFWGLIPVEKIENLSWALGEINYTCNLESITVEAGTYDVYNVSGDAYFENEVHDWYRSYYAEDVGNVAKVALNIDYATNYTYYNMEFELKSTTYTP